MPPCELTMTIRLEQRPSLKIQREAICEQVDTLRRSHTMPGTGAIEPPELLDTIHALEAAAATLDELPSILKRITDGSAALITSSGAYDRGCDHVRRGQEALAALVAGITLCPDCKGEGEGAASQSGAAFICPTCTGSGWVVKSGDTP